MTQTFPQLSPNEVLEKASGCFKTARKSFLEGAALLYVISEQNLTDGAYTSFNEYVQDACQISPSFASKLITIYKRYIVEGQLKPKELEGTDVEKLYNALQLPGSFAEKAVKAQTLTRQEIQDEIHSSPDGDCSHKVLIPYYKCKACSRFIDVN